MLLWLAQKAASYAFIPACTWVGATVGSHAGISLATKIWRASVDKISGVISVTLKRSRIYIVNKGRVIDIDPRKKYIIIRGEVIIMDACALEPKSIVTEDCDWTVI